MLCSVPHSAVSPAEPAASCSVRSRLIRAVRSFSSSAAARLKKLGQAKMTLEEKKQRRRALHDLGLPGFRHFLQQSNLAITRLPPKILQLNIGLYCNQV
ncbi:unnamed protein product, partial [Phaeothamnion confervicola]